MIFHLSTKEEQDYMAKSFKVIDIDGNGKISKEELMKGYKRLYNDKMTEDEIKFEVDLLWQQIDVDGSGEINYSEWAIAATNKEALLTDRRLAQAFNMFDVDRSGFISADELHQMLDPITTTKTSKSDW